MKRFTEQLNKKANSVKLRAAEKRELKERVVSYMEYHPLPAELKSVKVKDKGMVASPQFTEAFVAFKVPFAHIFKYSAVAAAIVLVVIPFVAERAVPGDALYAVKVQFNEEVRSNLTFDTYQKVEWETERLNRRIAEARLLASEGRLTEETEAEVANAVREHTANAKKGIEELRDQDQDAAIIASIALDSTLEVQSSSLKEEDNNAVGTDESDLVEKPVNLIASAIDESRDKDDASLATSTLPAYDKLMARVELNTTRIYELIEALERLAPAEELIDVSRRSDDINRAIQEAIEIAEEDEFKAREQLVAVVKRTQRFIVYLTELEVIKTVDIETLIPVVLTNSEKEIARASTVNKLEQKLVEIENKINRVESEEVLLKINFAQEQISLSLEETLPNTEDFIEFTTLSGELTALADDALLLISKNQLPAIETPKVEKSTSTATSTVGTAEPVTTTEPEEAVEVSTSTATISATTASGV